MNKNFSGRKSRQDFFYGRAARAQIGNSDKFRNINCALFLEAIEQIGDGSEDRAGFDRFVTRGGLAQRGADASEDLCRGWDFQFPAFFPQSARNDFSGTRGAA